MLAIPDRRPLAALVAEALREALRGGEWSGWLPGERALCERLGVSRPTLRLALAELQREGWVAVAQGRRRRILRGGSGGRRRAVAMLVPEPLLGLPAQVIFWVDRLRERLDAAGWEMEIHCDRGCYSGRPERALERRVGSAKAGAWLLLRATARVQRWFGRRGVACVLSGTCHGGIDLPAVDVDLRAVCRHAAGLLLGRGHRRIGLVIHRGGQAGDVASEGGFVEAFRARCAAGAMPVVARHDGSASGLRRCIEGLVRRADRPTAMIVARTAPALLALTHLQRLGFRVPRDISLIARDDDPFLDHTSPQLTRYRYDPEIHARRLFRLLLETAAGHPGRQVYGMARLVPGETVAPAGRKM